jgi:hypothetical protein
MSRLGQQTSCNESAKRQCAKQLTLGDFRTFPTDAVPHDVSKHESGPLKGLRDLNRGALLEDLKLIKRPSSLESMFEVVELGRDIRFDGHNQVKIDFSRPGNPTDNA